MKNIFEFKGLLAFSLAALMLISSSACDLAVNLGGEETEPPVITRPSKQPSNDETDEEDNDSTEAHATEAPTTNTPETNVPETNAPETNAPETNAPETNAPETNAPETNAPETSAPETNAPETNAPETKPESNESEETKTTDTEDYETDPTVTTSPENPEPTYETVTVNGGTNMLNILKDAIILKAGSPYACVNGVRVKCFSEDLLPIDDGEQILVPIRFLRETLGLALPDATATGRGYADTDSIYNWGVSVFYDQDLGIAVLTVNKKLKFNSGDLAYEFAYKACNTFAVGLQAHSAAMHTNRPVLFESDEMLSYSKKMAQNGIEPYASSLNGILAKAEYALVMGANPYTGSSCQEFRFAACEDFVNARYLALAYYNTQDAKYLNAAVEILKTYSESSPMLGTNEHLDYSAAKINGKSDIGLNIGLPLTAACEAYSIIYPYVSNSDKASIENWIRIEAELVIEGHENWIVNDYYDQQYGNNHLTCHLMAILSAAYVLEDNEMLSYVLEGSETNPKHFAEMINSGILMYGDDVWQGDSDDNFDEGEIYDRYRVVQQKGFGYSLYHLKFLTNCATILYNNGVDYFNYYGEGGENLLLPYLTYADYILDYDKITDEDGIVKSGHYKDSPINLEDAYNVYLLGYYHYKDETIGEVLKFLSDRDTQISDIELFGNTTAYIYGNYISE